MPNRTSVGNRYLIRPLIQAADRRSAVEARKISAVAADKVDMILERFKNVSIPSRYMEAMYRLHTVWGVMGVRADRG